MANLGKISTLFFVILLVASSLIAVESARAAEPKPSIPEFTLKYVVDSYDVPPTYKTDPYTGKSVIDESGFHVQNNTLEVTIKNQPFTSRMDSSGNYTSLYYAVAFKGHYETDLQYLPSNALVKGLPDDSFGNNVRGSAYLDASHSDYTIISLHNWQSGSVLDGGQIDFQVQAVLSYIDQSYSGGCFTGAQTTSVAQSDWSNTQTVTVSSPTYSNATTPPISTPNPTFNPYYPTATPFPLINPTTTPILPSTQTGGLFGFDWVQTALIVMAIVIAVLVVALVAVTWRRTSTE